MNTTQRTLIKNHLKQKLAELIQRTESRDTVVETCADDNEYASRISEQKINLALHMRERSLIHETEETLGRVDHYNFGVCSECEKTIGIPRIKAHPTTHLCVSCQELLEEEEGQLAWVG
ncbi:TraR/DksA family transcriptional regulator [Maridesulfovibrio frigidus]|uniref:TraR/DksA family transcriptional regulator n=1 Tax=Maridesulfovibrio frigidus TaxID=340956 RepID=UPI0004E28A9E|nr:TraR/DksA family transcriptional regulator [Maridesulfovibrio frigidus]